MYKFLLTTVLMFSVVFIAAVSPVSAAPDSTEHEWVDIVKKDAREAGNTLDEQALVAALKANELLVNEAVRLGIDKQPDFAARLEMKRRELLAVLVVKDYLEKNPLDEKMLKAEYDRIKALAGDKEYSARHIQLKTEAEAKAVIAELAKGADFAKLAKEKSLDTASKDKGGLTGWVAKNMLKPPLGNALSKLQKGLYNTVPLQTEAGWHVMKLEGVRDLKFPAYDKIKEQLRQRLKAQQANRFVESLRTRATP